MSATTTIRAMAAKTGMGDSPVVSATFTIKAETTTTTTTTTTGQNPAVEPVTDQEIADARNALARAREVDADYFDPDNYDAARQLLDEGIGLRTSDPGAARKKLTDSTDKADLAFTNSVQKSAEVMAANLEAARKRLLALEADKFALRRLPEGNRRHRRVGIPVREQGLRRRPRPRLPGPEGNDGPGEPAGNPPRRP